MSPTFNSSPTSSLGVEYELGLIDLQTGAYVCRASEVFTHLEDEGQEHPRIKHELLESTVEVITGVCSTVSEARADLAASIRELEHVVTPMGIGLVGLGIHPFTRWNELVRSPGERYEVLMERIGWPVRRLVTHGLHVHVGVRSPEKSIQIINALGTYLPVLLALSATSPYRHGHDTGLASTRTKIFEALPTSGLPPQLADWAEFTDLLDTMITAGSIQTVREIWWDIRPHPGFGTIELRMCDAPSSLWEVAALAALSQCLVQHFDELIDSGEPLPVPHEWVMKENKWRAARWGIDAEFIVDDAGNTRSMREITTALVEELRPVAERLSCVPELESVLRILAEGPGYVRMRAAVDAGASLPQLMLKLREELRDDVDVR